MNNNVLFTPHADHYTDIKYIEIIPAVPIRKFPQNLCITLSLPFAQHPLSIFSPETVLLPKQNLINFLIGIAKIIITIN